MAFRQSRTIILARHHPGRPQRHRRGRLRSLPRHARLIFDPKTYLYIGDSQIALNNTYMPKGTVNGNAVLQIAVVDKVGQLPG
jgi:hypothetical protein